MKRSLKKSQKKIKRSKLTKNDKAFIEFVKEECKRTGIKCDLRPTTFVKADGIMCAGYFDETNMQLVVAMNRHDSLGALAHEYCHLTQWEEGMRLWRLSDHALHQLHKWLRGKPVRHIRRHIATVRELELDNERRTAKMIKRWKLSIDVKEYVRGANAYIHFYNWLYLSRSWSEPRNGDDVVVDNMSSKFNMKYDQMSRKVAEVFALADL